MYHDSTKRLASSHLVYGRLSILAVAVLAIVFLVCGGGRVQAQADIAATYLGGNGEDWIMDMAIHPSGDIVVAGWSDSSPFPLGVENEHENQGSFDGFVMRLDSHLTQLVSVFFFVGNDDDRATTLEIAPDGTVVVGGLTSSEDFCVTDDAFDVSLGGFRDGFIAMVNTDPGVPDDERLIYSTFIGGSGEDGCVELKVDARGLVSTVGFTNSNDFPTTEGAFQEALHVAEKSV